MSLAKTHRFPLPANPADLYAHTVALIPFLSFTTDLTQNLQFLHSASFASTWVGAANERAAIANRSEYPPNSANHIAFIFTTSCHPRDGPSCGRGANQSNNYLCHPESRVSQTKALHCHPESRVSRGEGPCI